MTLHRRTIIHALGPLVTIGAAGCTSAGEATEEGTAPGGTKNAGLLERDADTGDATRTASPWILDKGTSLVSITVEDGFSGDVVLKADCRAEDVTVPPGASVGIRRRENGEDCLVVLRSDGEELYSGFVRMDQSLELTVQDDGEVKERISVI